MKGKVIAVEGVRITVLVPAGVAIVELSDRHAAEMGAVLDGDLESLGAARVFNESKQIAFYAYIEDCTWQVDDFTASFVDTEH